MLHLRLVRVQQASFISYSKFFRQNASFCLVGPDPDPDPDWTGGLFLLGSWPAGLVLLSDITMRPLILRPVRIVRDGAQYVRCVRPACPA
jgi:hypothetical protein